MGISYRGVIIVGYTYKQAHKLYELDELASGDFGDWIEDQGLEQSAPYFDGDREDCIYGVIVAKSSSYSSTILGLDLEDKLQEADLELSNKYGEEPEVYLMAEGS